MFSVTRQLVKSVRKFSPFAITKYSDNFRITKSSILPTGCQQIIQSAQRISTTPINLADNRSLVKLKKIQADFQRDDGRPVWLKAGFRDRILYSVTVLLVYIALFNVIILLYNHIKPNSWKVPPPC